MRIRSPVTGRPVRLILLSFEGPDPYALAGGLGVRVSGLTRAAARLGVQTDLIFFGDPETPAREVREDGRLVLHRWGQWLSRFHRAGVYDGEASKVADYTASVPPFVASLARQAIRLGYHVVVLAEEWQTAEALCRLVDLLRRDGLADRCTFLWNCNHPCCLDKVEWVRLRSRALITTVSQYMRRRLEDVGSPAAVVPNGIPATMLIPPPPAQVASLRAALQGRVSLIKVGRWDPDKAWVPTVDAVAALHRRGLSVRLLLRGGLEPHGEEVLRRCRDLGLRVHDVTWDGDGIPAFLGAITAGAHADVLNLQVPLADEHKRLLFCACDAVLANSTMEPFGLVGLEAMAAGGVAIVGSTGEDYASNENALRTSLGTIHELTGLIGGLAANPAVGRRLRAAGPPAARRFVWERVLVRTFLPVALGEVRVKADAAALQVTAGN